MRGIDETHDPARVSWVETANGHADFPIQNLPLGVFSRPGEAPRGGMAIGDRILDLASAARSGLFDGEAQTAAEAASGPALNPLLALAPAPRRALRRAASALLSDTARRSEVEVHLVEASDAIMHLPAVIGDYTDFYAGIHHAINVGRLFRPNDPLLPNYKHVPIGYHGRASSVWPTGTAVIRPSGQVKAADTESVFAPSRCLDFELELGAWIGGGNSLGRPIALAEAERHLAGLCLLNDWSARDIQAWEYQPLGPFLSKNFLTSVSPWIVTSEALEPYRTGPEPRPAGDPALLPYLDDPTDRARGSFSIDLEVRISTQQMREKGLENHVLSRSHARHMYWTLGQMVAHHTSNGCDLHPGDLLGTGTLSAPTPDGFGSLLELTRNGSAPIDIPGGETRGFLEDGDEILLSGRLITPGFVRMGFGECRGRVVAAYL